MRNTILLSIALPAFVIGAVLSLFVFTRDMHSTHHAETPPRVQNNDVFPSNSLQMSTFNRNSGTGSTTATLEPSTPISAVLPPEKTNKLDLVALFLFGTGLAGLASFVRKRFKISRPWAASLKGKVLSNSPKKSPSIPDAKPFAG